MQERQELISDIATGKAGFADIHKDLKRAAEDHAFNKSAMDQIPQDTRDKINAKLMELKRKHPHMKRDRLLRKAGEFYKVKFTFE